MKPYMLGPGEGKTYNYGIDHTVKLGEMAGRGAAFFEYTTRKGEEPPLHTHRTEDEVFYVLEGAVTFHCDGQDFPVAAGGFMFLPKGLQHGYTIASESDVRLLVVTFLTQELEGTGWGGYLADVEKDGTPVG